MGLWTDRAQSFQFPGTLETGGARPFQRTGTLETGGTQSCQPPVALESGGKQTFWLSRYPQVPGDWVLEDWSLRVVGFVPRAGTGI